MISRLNFVHFSFIVTKVIIIITIIIIIMIIIIIINTLFIL